MNNRQYIEQIGLCYGISFEDVLDDSMLNYQNYEIKTSMLYIKKLIELLKPVNKREVEIFLLRQEFKSLNPFWCIDLYKMLTSGSKFFNSIIDKHSGLLIELDVSMYKFINSTRVSDISKVEKQYNEMMKTLFSLLRYSKLLIDRKSINYLVFEDKNNVYTVNKLKNITSEKFAPGTCDVSHLGKYEDLNDLDKLINFNTAYLRISSK